MNRVTIDIDNYIQRDILEEIIAERQRQDSLFGPQNHPSVSQQLLNRPDGVTEDRMAREYEIPSQERAKYITNIYKGREELDWTFIIVEELAEAVSASAKADGWERRTELIQTAACILAEIECLHRRADLLLANLSWDAPAHNLCVLTIFGQKIGHIEWTETIPFGFRVFSNGRGRWETVFDTVEEAKTNLQGWALWTLNHQLVPIPAAVALEKNDE